MSLGGAPSEIRLRVPMLRENYSRSCRSPTTQAQCTKVMVCVVGCVTVVKLAAATADKLATGSKFPE